MFGSVILGKLRKWILFSEEGDRVGVWLMRYWVGISMSMIGWRRCRRLNRVEGTGGMVIQVACCRRVKLLGSIE